jgi:serine kinase of HPr protein (carbohydrate metabolism regulator)
MPARQASCVAIGSRALMIVGAPGTGKSSLALALIDRGAVLIGDDSVVLEAEAGRLVARPHAKTRGFIEVRNLGLIEMPVCDAAPVALVVRLDEAAPRYVEDAESTAIGGIILPLVRLWPGGAVPALKAELALRRFGLSLG